MNDTAVVGELIEKNDAILPTVDSLVNDYRRGFVKTVEGILVMGKAVYEADSLNRDDKNKFYIEANLVKNSATSKKFKAIGEKYFLFQEKQDSLPLAWTSIYQLTKLSDEKFIEYIEDEKINPDKTGNEIRALVEGKKNSNPSSTKTVNQENKNEGWSLNEDTSDLLFHIRIKGDDTSKIQNLLKTLNDLAEEDVSVKGNEKFNVVRDLYAVRNGG
mgnify:CR=1 FL=1